MTQPPPAPDFAADPFASPDADLPPVPAAEPPLRVLKFGSSVLQSVADLPRIVGETYRQHRAGPQLVWSRRRCERAERRIRRDFPAGSF